MKQAYHGQVVVEHSLIQSQLAMCWPFEGEDGPSLRRVR